MNKENKIISLKLDRNLIFLFVLLGVILNLVVIFANDYRMPVQTENKINTSRHFNFINKELVPFYQLSDVFKINIKNNILHFSAGDFLIIISCLIFILTQIKIIILSFKLRSE